MLLSFVSYLADGEAALPALPRRSDDRFLVVPIVLQLVWQVCANDECNSSGVRPLDELEARCAPTTSAAFSM